MSGSGEFVSEFAGLYKLTGILNNQEERRNKLLEELKQRRSNVVDEKRGITELFSNVTAVSDETPMEIASENVRKKRRFRNRIMLSEWLKDVPGDLEENWIVKLCPIGVRNLVIANHHKTKSYNKYGELQAQFSSSLPGGDLRSGYNKFSILDCIFSKKTGCYYVLDIVAWNSISYCNCDTEFRFFWLKSKFEEFPTLRVKSDFNQYPFIDVSYMMAERNLIREALKDPYSLSNEGIGLDGVLFYHKQTHYIHGFNPLIGWLKPFMVPEILNVSVHESYTETLPKNYTCMEYYLQLLAEMKKKKKCKPSEEVEMDV